MALSHKELNLYIKTQWLGFKVITKFEHMEPYFLPLFSSRK